MLWHTRIEQKVIKKYGGKPLVKQGYDGMLKGKPVEVRAVKKDNRYRIQQDVHRHLIANDGKYIFVNKHGQSKMIPAKAVSRKLDNGKWFKDRKYPHKFLGVEDVF